MKNYFLDNCLSLHQPPQPTLFIYNEHGPYMYRITHSKSTLSSLSKLKTCQPIPMHSGNESLNKVLFTDQDGCIKDEWLGKTFLVKRKLYFGLGSIRSGLFRPGSFRLWVISTWYVWGHFGLFPYPSLYLPSSAANNFIPPKPNKEIFKQSMSYSGSIIWKNLPYSLKAAETMNSFHLRCIKWIRNSDRPQLM